MLGDWLNDAEDIGDEVDTWLPEGDCVAVTVELGVPVADSVGA